MAKDNSGYDPAALGGTFGKQLEGYLNTPAPGFSNDSQTAITQMRDTANLGQWSDNFGKAFRGAGDLIGQGGLTPGMNQSIGYADDAAKDYASMADAFGTPGGEPGYQTLRNKLSDDVTTQNLSAFNNSGMFGSDDNRSSLAEGLGNALGGLDYQNYQQGIQNRMGALQGQLGASGQGFGQRQQGIVNTQTASSMLPSLYAGTLMPSQTLMDIGNLQQQNQNKDYNRFQELLSAFTGSSGNPGMEEQPDWWQVLLGGAGSLAGAFF
jgi:hypothetical protein